MYAIYGLTKAISTAAKGCAPGLRFPQNHVSACLSTPREQTNIQILKIIVKG